MRRKHLCSVTGFTSQGPWEFMWVCFLETNAGVRNSAGMTWNFGDMKQREKQEQYSREKSDLRTHKVDPASHPIRSRKKGKTHCNWNWKWNRQVHGDTGRKFSKITSGGEAECQALMGLPQCLGMKRNGVQVCWDTWEEGFSQIRLFIRGIDIWWKGYSYPHNKFSQWVMDFERLWFEGREHGDVLFWCLLKRAFCGKRSWPTVSSCFY